MNLSAKEKISYGVGAVGKDMVYMLTASYILYYYEDILGVSAVFTGILLLIARVFDAANDPVMGVLVARTKSRFGKFRPWLFSGTLINALVLYAMFAVPEKLEGNPLLIYISVAYILWGVTYTMMDIPYWSMIPAFARDGKERESLSTLGRTCAGAGSALVPVITMPAVYFLGNGNERAGFRWFALTVAVFFAFTAIFMCLCIKEKSTVDMPVNSIGDMFRALVRNDQAMTVVVSIVLINSSIYLTSNLVIYFFKYDFGGEGWQNAYTLFNTFGGAVQILSMMLLYPLLRKFLSTVQVFRTSLGMAAVGYAVLLVLACINMSNVFVLFIPGFFIFAAAFLEKNPGVFRKAVLSSPMIRPLTGGIPFSVAYGIAVIQCRLGKGGCYVVGHHAFSGDETFEGSASVSEERYGYYARKRQSEVKFQTNGASYSWLREAARLSKYVLNKANCRKITAGVLVFQAERDEYVDKKAQETFVSRVENARLVPMAGTKHEIYMSDDGCMRLYLSEILAFFWADREKLLERAI